MAMRSTVLSIVACLLGGAALAASADTPSGADTQGSWQSHETQFHYMGFTSTYSCDGLADKLTLLLHLAGAGPDSKAIPLCSRGFGAPDRLAEARLKFTTLKSSDSTAAAAGSEVAGTWRHVQFSPRHPFELQTGDCELIEQFHDKLLPLFDTRNVQYQITCVPHQESGSHYSLSFDVLVPAPKSPASAASKGA
ncbi:MAG: hypothetical protein ACRESY_00380 [Steroidobacteraceae bacterium]